MKSKTLAAITILLLLLSTGCEKAELQDIMRDSLSSIDESFSFSESERQTLDTETLIVTEKTSEDDSESILSQDIETNNSDSHTSDIFSDEPEPIANASTSDKDTQSITPPSVQTSENNLIETKKEPVIIQPNIPTQAPVEIQEPETEIIKETAKDTVQIEATQPEKKPNEPEFDIDYWINFAKNYAVSIGLELSPAAIECWDNPMVAGAHCKYLERDIKDLMNFYKNVEGFTGIWVWAEADGKGSYLLYVE